MIRSLFRNLGDSIGACIEGCICIPINLVALVLFGIAHLVGKAIRRQ